MEADFDISHLTGAHRLRRCRPIKLKLLSAALALWSERDVTHTEQSSPNGGTSALGNLAS